MGLLDRIGGKVKAGFDAALAPAADPRQVYISAYQRQRELLAEVGTAMRQVSASKRRLEQKTSDVKAKLPTLQDEARVALGAGRVEQARLALQHRQLALRELQTLERQVADVAREEAGLAVIEQRLGGQVEAFAARQEVILARYSAAEAQVRINEAVTGVSQEFAHLAAALQKAEERTESMQARAIAIDRLVQEGVIDAGALTASALGIDAELSQSGADQLVEDQLAALAREVGLQLPGPA